MEPSVVHFAMKNIKTPVYIWENFDNVESSALDQLKEVSNLPILIGHVAAMPDVHCGYGVPIGTVLATQKYIIPNAVGVDIGCGMIQVSMPMPSSFSVERPYVVEDCYKTIPVGKNSHKTPIVESYLVDNYSLKDLHPIKDEYEFSLRQIGTLGGGNHFIEFQTTEDKSILSIMIHSGSRNLGKKVCDMYHKIALDIRDKYYSGMDIPKDLSFLPLEHPAATAYINAMKYCINYARLNRITLMNQVLKILLKHVPETKIPSIYSYLNIPHNFAKIENHKGKNLWIHRKGATPAFKNQIGIIPGSQGAPSYIVKGLGNPDSFCSSSHGAGRVFSRKKAKEVLNLEEQQKILGNRTKPLTKGKLDEAPGAYKDIDSVMEKQKDLVEIVTKLIPIDTIKG